MAASGLTRSAKKSAALQRIINREAEQAQTKLINDILKVPCDERTVEQKSILENAPDVVDLLQERAKTREKQKERCLEKEDSIEELKTKCMQLARALGESRFTVVYTGAGISTAASIPDYRGPNGVWTMLRRGEVPRAQDLSDAEPTYTHMCITKLHREGMIQHVVSQNCDGLHMRSGLPRTALSELHGNMYLELCRECEPVAEHIRLFDVTERTGLRKHKTGRKCPKCRGDLVDSIIHFGEKGPLHSPYNWKQAAKAADEAELVVCLGTSLKVLRRYACLWNMHKPPSERPKLVVINLMWTPKDDMATLKINGKCDEAIKLVMGYLGFTPEPYARLLDPIFTYAVPLTKREAHTTSKKILQEPAGYNKATICTMLSDLIAQRPPVAAECDEEVTHENKTNANRYSTRKRKHSSKMKEIIARESEILTESDDDRCSAVVQEKVNRSTQYCKHATSLAKRGKNSSKKGRPRKRGRPPNRKLLSKGGDLGKVNCLNTSTEETEKQTEQIAERNSDKCEEIIDSKLESVKQCLDEEQGQRCLGEESTHQNVGVTKDTTTGEEGMNERDMNEDRGRALDAPLELKCSTADSVKCDSPGEGQGSTQVVAEKQEGNSLHPSATDAETTLPGDESTAVQQALACHTDSVPEDADVNTAFKSAKPTPSCDTKKKTLNNLLEKIQARRSSVTDTVCEPLKVVVEPKVLEPSCKPPKKIKDLLAESHHLSTSPRSSNSIINSSLGSTSFSNNQNVARASEGRVVCVNGCEGYEPGEVHTHSPNHVSVDSTGVLGIPNLDINQVWAATYSACFMASYQTLQNQVLQQAHSPPAKRQIAQPDLLNLVSDSNFQAQLLTQFQKNLLRSMAGVVSPEKQAQVLAQTQQVLMQNIAGMQNAHAGENSNSPLSKPVTAAEKFVGTVPFGSPATLLSPKREEVHGSSDVIVPHSGSQPATSPVNTSVTSSLTSPPRALASPASSTSSSEVNLITGSAGCQQGLSSPRTSPSPRSKSISPGARSKLSRGVCGPRVKHKKKWWEVEPTDEVSSIVEKHLHNIRKAAEERSQVRQEIERRAQSLPGSLGIQAPQRCKRRSVDSVSPNEQDLLTSYRTSHKQQQREAALRALISAQYQYSSPQSATLHIARDDTPVAVTADGQQNGDKSDVVSIEPEAPDENGDAMESEEGDVTADAADSPVTQLPSSAPAIMPGWFGKGWRANKKVRRKKSR